MVPALTGPVLVGAALLALAAPGKWRRPASTANALRALGLPSATALVRLLAVGEVALAAAVLLVPGRAVLAALGLAYLAFAGVVVAAPADAAAVVLGRVAPDASALLDRTDFASVVMVVLVADRAAVQHPLDASGVVVARDAGLSITAASFGSSKWAGWDDGEHAVFRVSLGHDGDPTDWCARTDEELAGTARADLERLLGEPIRPVGVRVGRWPHAFPQYRPGHLDRVAELRATIHAVAPIAVAGMSFDGIGVPACIRSGRTAARHLLG